MKVTINEKIHFKNLPASESLGNVRSSTVHLKQHKEDTLEERCAKTIANELHVEKTTTEYGSIVTIHNNPASIWNQNERKVLENHPVTDTVDTIINKNLV